MVQEKEPHSRVVTTLEGHRRRCWIGNGSGQLGKARNWSIKAGVRSSPSTARPVAARAAVYFPAPQPTSRISASSSGGRNLSTSSTWRRT